ncbi:hypothetical protein FHG87_007083 [Trinorchestia longiramus]|nr:hypothetical protein FHG87_007083 [Trinorchestia longiramus]
MSPTIHEHLGKISKSGSKNPCWKPSLACVGACVQAVGTAADWPVWQKITVSAGLGDGGGELGGGGGELGGGGGELGGGGGELGGGGGELGGGGGELGDGGGELGDGGGELGRSDYEHEEPVFIS